MKTESTLTAEASCFIGDFQLDHDVELIGEETEEQDFQESPYSVGHPDNIRYATTHFIRHTFSATGFIWKHPHGAIIYGSFAQPIKAFEREVDLEGVELDTDHFCANVRKAIVAKCGSISGFAECGLNY